MIKLYKTNKNNNKTKICFALVALEAYLDYLDALNPK